MRHLNERVNRILNLTLGLEVAKLDVLNWAYQVTSEADTENGYLNFESIGLVRHFVSGINVSSGEEFLRSIF